MQHHSIFLLARHLRTAALIASLGLLFIGPDAQGIGRYWLGTAGNNWSTPANWSPTGLPQNEDILHFTNRVSSYITNDLIGLSVQGLDFQLAFAVVGKPLTITTFGINYTGTELGMAINLDGLIVGDRSGVNAFSGPIVINSPINLNGFAFGVYAPSSNSGASVVLQGAIFGSGDFFSSGTNYLSPINVNNSFTGRVTVEYGTLYLGAFNGIAISAQSQLEINSGAVVKLSYDSQIDASAPVLIHAGGQLLLNGHVNSFNNIEMQGGLLDSGSAGRIYLYGRVQVNATNETARITGWLTLLAVSSTETEFNVNGPWYPNLTLAANVSGTGFIKTGFGTMRISGDNDYDASVKISQGVVEADSNKAFGMGAGSGGTTLAGGSISLRGVNIAGESLFIFGGEPQLDGRNGQLLTSFNTSTWGGPIVLHSNLFVYAGGDLTLSGPITGPGGMSFWSGTAHLTGTQVNTFTGTTIVRCDLLEFNKPYGVYAFTGPLVVGGGAGGPYEARWLNSYQNGGPTATLYANGIINLNNHNEGFGPLTFNGGEVDTGTGEFDMYGTLTVNPADTSAVINGHLGLPSGDNRVFIVGDGAADCDLLINAEVLGTPHAFVVKQGPGTMCLAHANSYDATTLLEEGIIDVNNDTALGTSVGTIIFDGATLRLNGGGNMSEGLEVLGAGVGGTHGAIEVTPNSSFNITGAILLDGATTINIGQSAGLGLLAHIDGSGPLTKTGPGVLLFGGGTDNTYTGDTAINAGQFLLNKSANHISVPGNLVVGPGPSGPVTFARLLQVGGLGSTTVKVNGNSLFDLNGFNQALTQLILNDGGRVETGGALLSFNSGGVVTVGSLNGLGSHAGSTINGIIGLPANDFVTFNVGPHAPTPPLLFTPELDVTASIPVPVEQAGIIPAGIIKEGLGRMRLGGNNTYKGRTVVNSGTLQVDGSQPQSVVVVNSGAQLQGAGTVGIIANSGTVSPGVGTGILTCSDFNPSPGNGTLQVELNGTTLGSGYNQLTVHGTVNLTGVSLAGLLNFPSAVADQFIIINNDGSNAVIGTFNGLPQNGTLYIGGQLFQISYTGGTGNDVLLSHMVTPPLPKVKIQNISSSSIVFSWPTNDPAFLLQYTTELGTNNWSSVTQAPVIVGSNYVLSNAPTGPQMFFRLIR